MAERTDFDIGKDMNRFFGNPEGPEDTAIATDEEVTGTDAEATTRIEGTAEAEDESDGEQAEDDGEEAVTPEPFLTLVVEGQEIKVGSKDEATALAQQGLHYSKKMTALREREAQLAGEIEQRSQGVQQREQQYTTALQTLHDVYGHVLGQNAPDWASPEMQKLKAEKPDEYVGLRDQWDQLGAIRGELSRIQQQKQQESQKQWQQWVTKEQEALVEKVPEWTDASRRQADWTLITSYAQSIGIQAEELSGVYDHRQWLILRDAARYRQAEAAGKQKRETVVSQTAPPGSGKNVNQGNRQLQSRREQLRQTGDVRAAGDILQTIMTTRK